MYIYIYLFKLYRTTSALERISILPVQDLNRVRL